MSFTAGGVVKDNKIYKLSFRYVRKSTNEDERAEDFEKHYRLISQH